jgi:hypothetical protein
MRLLVTGNCHAQYLGAALSTLPETEVVVWGLPYPGPIHFQGAIARMLPGPAARVWMRGGAVVLRQVTYLIPPPIEEMGASTLDQILYPYFEHRGRFGAGSSHFTNEQAFEIAGLDPCPIVALMEKPGGAMGYNKFSGEVFAQLLAQLAPALSRHTRPEPLLGLVDRMRADRGLAHSPDPSLLVDPPNAELADQAEWGASMESYRRDGAPGAMARCIALYRPRRSTAWAMEMSQTLIGRKRVDLATRLLCSHLAYEDARGRLFNHALRYCFEVRTNYAAFRVLERAAQAAPDSSLPLWLACVRRMN